VDDHTLLSAVNQSDQKDVIEERHGKKSELDAAIVVNIAIAQMVRLAMMRMGYSMPKEWDMRSL
jgi:hypothetical protein